MLGGAINIIIRFIVLLACGFNFIFITLRRQLLLRPLKPSNGHQSPIPPHGQPQGIIKYIGNRPEWGPKELKSLVDRFETHLHLLPLSTSLHAMKEFYSWLFSCIEPTIHQKVLITTTSSLTFVLLQLPNRVKFSHPL